MADPQKKKPEDQDPIAALPAGMAAGMARLQGPTTPGVSNARPLQRTGATSFSATGGAKPVPTGVNSNAPAPVPAAPAAPAATLQRAPGGTQVGHLTLVPGSGADRAVKALGGFFSGLQEKQAAAHANASKVMAAANTGVAPDTPTPIPAAPAATPTLRRAPVAAPAVAAPAVARGAVATPPAAAATPVVAAPAAPVLKPGDVNTYTGANGITRAVPGMTTAPGGVGAVGGGPVVVPSVPTGAAAAIQTEAPQVVAPSLVLPRRLSGDLSGAERERQALLSDLDSQRFALGSLNSRGKRQLAMQLQDQAYGLTRDRISQQTGLETEGARLDAGAAEAQARLAAEAGEGNANRTQRASEANQAATLRREEASRPQQVLTGEDGTSTLLRGDGSVTPLVGADGKPFRQRNTAGSITDSDLFNAYTEELSGLNENVLLKPEERAAQIQALNARPEYARILQQLGGKPQGAPAEGTVKDGYRFKGGNPADPQSWEKVQ